MNKINILKASLIIAFGFGLINTNAQERIEKTIYVDGVETKTVSFERDGYNVILVNTDGKRTNNIYTKNGITVAGNLRVHKEYGNYIALDLVITNASSETFNFVPKNDVKASAKSLVRKGKINSWINFKEYDAIVKRRQNGNAMLVALATGMAAGYTAAQGVQVNTVGNVGGINFSSNTKYTSPILTYAATKRAMDITSDFVGLQAQARDAAKKSYLKANTIESGQTIGGYILIPLKGLKGKFSGTYDIFVNGTKFTFSYTKS